jgi:hypothetical protein
MHILHNLAEYSMSIWLWHFTWGWTQVTLSALLTGIFLWLLAKTSWLQSVILSLIAHVSVSVIFSAFVYIFFLHGCELDFIDTDEYMMVYTQIYRVTLSFALLYGFLLSLFFTVFNYAYALKLTRVYAAVMISSILSAIIAPYFICF